VMCLWGGEDEDDGAVGEQTSGAAEERTRRGVAPEAAVHARGLEHARLMSTEDELVRRYEVNPLV
jgi:hypothetical protein